MKTAVEDDVRAAIRVTSPSLALYRCGSTPGPISPVTGPVPPDLPAMS